MSGPNLNLYGDPYSDLAGADFELRGAAAAETVVQAYGKGGDNPGALGSPLAWREAYQSAPRLKLERGRNGDEKLVGRKSDIAQAILHHLGRPLRLDQHAFFLPAYNAGDERVVLKCARQVAKSTLIAVLLATEAIIRPHWRSLYVSPSALQTRQFSNEKLRPTLYESPWVTRHLLKKGVIDQVFEKTLSNGSYIFLRYAFLTPARARGIPASRVFFDEVQDLLKDNVKIISQSLSASRVAAGVAGAELLAGTPLTFANTLEEYWRWSTQAEWLVPCERHTPRYWNLLGIENIGKRGLVCAHRRGKKGCGETIDPARGQWVWTAPPGSSDDDEGGAYYTGYHVSQLMVPWKQSPEAWRSDIVLPLERWPEGKFYNEILGLSFDSAGAPVTALELQRCCYPTKQLATIPSARYTHVRHPVHSGLRIFAGIDWGEGRSEGNVEGGKKRFASFTVLTLGAYVTQDLFWVFLQKRYTGKDVDPELIIPDVLNICGQFGVEVIGCDWGHGWGVNSRLMAARGRERVMQFAYSTSLGERKRWDAEAYKWIINRNAVLSGFFYDVKQEKFLFPAWAECEPFAKDILAEYVEYNERTRTMSYDHPLDQPDDGLHSAVYSKLAADIVLGRF